MKRLLATILLLASCDGAGLTVATPFDAGSIDTEPACAQWGRVSVCPDGTPGCDAIVCISYTPRACPAPWPCPDSGE